MRHAIKSFRWLCYALAALGLAVACHRLQPATAQGSMPEPSALREAVIECIPDQPPGIVEEVLLAAQAEVEGTTYYWFYAYDAPIPEEALATPTDPTTPNYAGYPGDLIISVTDGTCEEEWFNPMADPIPISEPLGQRPARLLTLDRYQRTIERIGRDGLQTRINSWVEDAEETGGTLRDAEYWALQQLGMDIPPILIPEGGTE